MSNKLFEHDNNNLFADHAAAEKQHKKVRESATPSQLKMLEKFDEEFEQEAENFSKLMDAEMFSRREVGKMMGVSRPATVSECEVYSDLHKRLKKGETGNIGNIAMYKTHVNTLVSAVQYIYALEKTIIKVTEDNNAPNLSIYGLIKMIFKKLLGGK